MTVDSLDIKLCRNFCHYYKPSKDDKLACMGFIVIERLMRKGRAIPFGKTGNLRDFAAEKKLSCNVCRACPFHENDCDFAAGKEGSSPCGGFSLLGSLISRKIITFDDVNEAIKAL